MIINPLNLKGPEFLMFYLIYGGIIFLTLKYLIKMKELKLPISSLDLTDPYEIAYLRGGENEALRIAALSLIDRELLMVDGENLKTKYNAEEHARRPIEKAILKIFQRGETASSMFDGTLSSACMAYVRSLEKLRLIPSKTVMTERLTYLCLGFVLLVGMSTSKIFVAISKGKTNVELLMFLTFFFSFSIYKIYKRERTALGDRVLTDLKTLFSGLEKRGKFIKAGGATNEAALLAAVFGVSALSTKSFPHVRSLFPKATTSGSSCGSTCGSSSDSSGSSCSGGCGGGCGGCGS